MFNTQHSILLVGAALNNVLGESLLGKLALKALPKTKTTPHDYLEHQPSQFEAAPGAIATSLKVSSIQNIMRLAFPLVSNEMFQNTTYPTDVDFNLLGSHLNISEVHVNDVTGFSLISFGFVEDTDMLNLIVNDINIDMDLESYIKTLKLPKAHLKNIKISGLDVNMNITSEALADNVRYELGLQSHFSVKDIDMTFKPFYMQKLYNANKWWIMKSVNWLLGDFFPKFINAAVDDLNWKIYNEVNGETFMVNVGPINSI